ncbi:hypothetical protein WJX79_010799 [Trebouxia sp. C0005]
MAYILPSTKAKRVKRIDQHGQEELEADDKVAFQQSADAAAQVVIAAAESEAENAEAEQAPAAATPREVIEQLSAAKGELDIVLDLINLMEAQKYLGVANVALSSNIQQKQQQQAIRLQQKVSKLKDAGSRLRRGSAALKARSVTDHLFFVQLGQLQQHWNLKRSAPGSAGHFQIDVALPLGSQWQLHRKEQQPDTLIDVIQAPDGTVQLQSAGLPLPDQALRWLTPLPRPLHTPSLATNPHLQAPSSDSPHAEGTDTVMQDAQPPDEQQMRQQRVKQEVRQVQGPQDMDDGAVELVKKVFSEAALSPIVRALQLRLLRLLLLDSDSQQRHSILAELQYLS